MSAEPTQHAEQLPPLLRTLIGGPCHGQPIGDHIARTRPETIMSVPANDVGARPVAYGRRWLTAPFEVDFYVPSETPVNPDSITLLWNWLLLLAGAR